MDQLLVAIQSTILQPSINVLDSYTRISLRITDMKNRSPHKSSLLPLGPLVAVVAAVLLVISLILSYAVIPSVIRGMILRETRLVNGSSTWEKWANVKAPILIKFFLFNVTNVEDAKHGAKFAVQEIGPYVWEEKRTKLILEVDDEEDTVTYRETIWYYFRPDLSVGSQEDTLHVVNIPFISASTLIYKLLYPSLANHVIEFLANMGENFVLRDVNVRELVFDGVELNIAYSTLADIGVVDLPEEFFNGTFAFYNRKNGTSSKSYTIGRGIKNHQNFGRIMTYDNSTEVSWWTNKSLPANAEQHCNKINGSDGSVFPPFITKDRRIYMFSPDICRSIYLEYQDEINFKGIPAYRFTPSERLLVSPNENEANQCFCTDPGHGLAHYCNVSGIIRIFSCKRGTPIALTLPHFLSASKWYLDHVDGLSPDQAKHQMSLTVEPNSGALLQIVKRLQIVQQLQRLPGIHMYRNISEAMIPIFWVEERADPDEGDLAEIRDRLVGPLQLIKILKPLFIAFFTCLLLLGIIVTAHKKRVEESLLQNGVHCHRGNDSDAADIGK